MSHSPRRNFSSPSEFKCVGASEKQKAEGPHTPAYQMIESPSGTKGRFIMKYLRYVALLAVLAMPFAYAQAAVTVGVGIGGVGVVAGAPVCAYGYYPDYPYACAPYGYYGPSWFAGGVFIGAGPWYHGFGRPFYPGRPFARGFAGPRGFVGRGPVERGSVWHGPAPRSGGFEARGSARGSFGGGRGGFRGGR
jgi:hypothetical protein